MNQMLRLRRPTRSRAQRRAMHVRACIDHARCVNRVASSRSRIGRCIVHRV
jgi:hypothetical protein